jgi:uncharacterized protein (DUF488 family)
MIYTIGHSTRSLDEFLALLREHAVARVADIRRYPGSRRYPHFSRESLEVTLPGAAIEYVHMPELGGRRKARPDSPNAAWRKEQFRAYADHMATPEFHTAIAELLDSAHITAYMCAEAVPWRCHRNLVSDEMVRRGIEVQHIIGPGSTQTHVLNPMARVDGDHLIYPAEGAQRPLDLC